MADLGLLSLIELQKLALSQQNQLHPNLPPSPWMWNPKQAHQDHHHQEEDSWEVRAFAEDTANAMGTTWPPRSYTCTFCRREFRSAQALGGHMNVHRRDRARLHQAHPNNPTANPAAVSSSTSSFIIPTQEFVTSNGGLCLLYQLPSPNTGTAAAFMTTPTSAFNSSCAESSSPSTLLSMLPSNPPDYLVSFPVVPHRSTNSSSYCHSSRSSAGIPSTSGNDQNDNEELDLELRLGHGPTLPS